MPPDKPKRTSERQTLAVEEWDFSRCTSDELGYCCYYEYARMDDKIRDQVARLRTSGHSGPGLFPGDADYYPDAWFRKFFRDLSLFPETPWLKIDQATRQKVRTACEQIEGPFVSVDPARYFNEEEQYPYYPTDVGVFGLRSVHAVEVDWTASDEAILAAFVRWRDTNRPSEEVILERRGRGGARELLKFLGAYRLMQTFDNDSVAATEWVDARTSNAAKGQSAGLPKYNDESAWRKAARKAKRLIEQGVGLTPAVMLEGKLRASNMSAVQRARVAVAIEQAKKAERGRATLDKAERVLAAAKRTVTRSTIKAD